MTDLREALISEIEHFGHGYGEDAENLADRILAMLPQQPKLEWRGRFLFVGGSDFQVGEVIAHTDDKWDGFLSADVLVVEYVPSEPVARAAVEQAVKEALGWKD